MQAHNLVTLVSVAAVLLFIVTGGRVGWARGKFDVKAPAMSGHDIFERHFRVQMNTLEQLVIFLPALWLFALHWNNVVAAALGVVWLIGRVLYMTSYVADPSKRGPGFLIGGIASLILLIGGAVGAVMSIAATGAL